ncbi:MAG TPA: hypothetical protein IAA88_01305 [Candidatus Avimuribaculum pullicola]|nr:hypothetical protein [Candidatus Avimuribaculum pullicola]
MSKKVIFLHGFFASGACTLAQTLKLELDGLAQVLSPDLPLHPHEAIKQIFTICQQESPDALVGNSNGAFLAQIVAAKLRLPALLGNPHLEMTRFLAERIGSHQYKSPRADGNQSLVIDQTLIKEFNELQLHQWDNCNPISRDMVWGLFGTSDPIAHYEPQFLQHYTHAFHFPGAHTPTAEEAKLYYVPLIKKLLALQY